MNSSEFRYVDMALKLGASPTTTCVEIAEYFKNKGLNVVYHSSNKFWRLYPEGW